jgi:hypothetical protein
VANNNLVFIMLLDQLLSGQCPTANLMFGKCPCEKFAMFFVSSPTINYVDSQVWEYSTAFKKYCECI